MSGNQFMLIAKDFPGSKELIRALTKSPIKAGQVIPLSDEAMNAFRMATDFVDLPDKREDVIQLGEVTLKSVGD